MPPPGTQQIHLQENPYHTMALSGTGASNAATGSSSQLMCRSESIQLVLDCSQGSGLCLAPLPPSAKTNDRLVYQIVQIVKDSVADRSGCIQKGDRLLAVNKLYNLDVQTVRQLLGDMKTPQQLLGGPASANWVELEVEFDMFDSVIPSSGVFNVKLARNGANGLGITVNATNDGKGSTNSVNNGGGGGGGNSPTFVITDVKPGSPAHRTGSLRAGDVLLAVDSYQLQHFNVDALLKENKGDFTTLTIKRTSLPDFLFDAQQQQQRRSPNPIYSNATPGGTVVTATKSCSEPRLDLSRGISLDKGVQAQQQMPTIDVYQPLELESPSYGYLPHPMTQLRRPYIMMGGESVTPTNRMIPEDPYGEIEGYSEYFQTFYK